MLFLVSAGSIASILILLLCKKYFRIPVSLFQFIFCFFLSWLALYLFLWGSTDSSKIFVLLYQPSVFLQPRYVLSIFVAAVVCGLLLGLGCYLFKPLGKGGQAKKHLLSVGELHLFPKISLLYLSVFTVVILYMLVIVDNALIPYRMYFDETNKICFINSERLYVNKKIYPLVSVSTLQPKAGATKRVLVLGDSFVFGYGLTNMNQVWWKLLETELQEKGYNCEVYGVGFTGASTQEQLQWLTKTTMIADIQPDIILMDYVVNDPFIMINGNTSPPWYALFSERLGLDFFNKPAHLVPNIEFFMNHKLAERVSFSENRFNNAQDGYQYFYAINKALEPAYLSQYKTNVIDPLGEFAAKADMPVILMTTPENPSVEFFESKYKPVLPLFEQAGISTYNSLYEYEKSYSAEKYSNYYAINPADSHPGPVGSLFFAQYAANLLEANYSDILGAKAERSQAPDHTINDYLPASIHLRSEIKDNLTGSYTFTYPADDDQTPFLVLPLREPYIKLNFRKPIQIDSLSLRGSSLKSATLYYNSINDELGFDDQVAHKMGKKSGSECMWDNTADALVTSILIHADIAGGSAGEMQLTVSLAEGGDAA